MSPDAESSLAGHHLILETDFDDIAAGVDDDTVVRRLCIVERSYRLLALRALLDIGRVHASVNGRLPSLDAAWDLLVRAERASAEGVVAVLDRPQTSAWVSRVLRRIIADPEDYVPLWVDLGYLHCLAVAAAIHAGVRFDMKIPLRHGVLHLPSLGSVRIGASEVWGVAMVRSDGRSVHAFSSVRCVRLPLGQDCGSTPWDFPIQLRAQHRNRHLAVWLDNADPFRIGATAAVPEKPSVALIQHWEAQLRTAWIHLVEQDERSAVALAECVVSLVPLPRAERFRESSASSGDSFGSMALSLPDTPTQLAATLVHEVQHAKLGVLLHVLSFLLDDGRDLVYAPWRDDPRPLQGLLQGIFAHFGVAEFWRVQRNRADGAEAATAHFEFALLRRKIWRALALVRERTEFTPLGRRFLAVIETTVIGWLAEPVPPQYAELAELADRDHLAGWRIHHLTAPEGLVRELAVAWHDGTDPGKLPTAQPSQLTPDESVQNLDTRMVLIRYWLGDRNEFRRLEQSDVAVCGHVSGASMADLHLIAGRPEEAQKLYLAELEAPACRTAAWPGLGLALLLQDDRRSAAAARAILDRPELVRAVLRAVEYPGQGRPPILDLAAWLGEFSDLTETSSGIVDRSRGTFFTDFAMP